MNSIDPPSISHPAYSWVSSIIFCNYSTILKQQHPLPTTTHLRHPTIIKPSIAMISEYGRCPSAHQRARSATNKHTQLEERAEKLYPYDPKRPRGRNAWTKGWGQDRVSREFVDWNGVNAKKRQNEINDERSEKDARYEEVEYEAEEEFEELEQDQYFGEELREKDSETEPSMSNSDTRARLTSSQAPDTVSSRQGWKVFRRRPGMELQLW